LPGNVKSIGWQWLSPVITISLIVQNTSNHSFNLLSIAGDLYSVKSDNDYLLGHISDFTSQTIAPNSETVVDVAVRLELLGIVSDLFNSVNTGIAQTIHLSALANVDQIQVPLEYDYQIG
jgi:hypothetical protein